MAGPPGQRRRSRATRLTDGSPVIHLIHNATDEDGNTLEVSESVWPSDRVIVIDNYDIAREAEDQAGMSDV